ncbi:MAG: ATP-binding cassette domain-containing protein [Thermoprotei archaeon]
MAVSIKTGVGERNSKDNIIIVRNLSKRFPGVIALDHVNLGIKRGEIHALLGENGAGKSTLVKILYGIYTPDEGEIIVNGRKVLILSPRDAVANGIVLVSQSPVLIERLTVAENIILSLKHYKLLTSTRKVYRELNRVLEELGTKIDPNEEVYRLSYTQKQLVEIARALLLKARVLLLDEALTYLPVIERRKIFEFLKKFVSEGNSAVVITHKLPLALEISDRITVLRRGRVVGTVEKSRADINTIRKMMFGEEAYTSTTVKHEERKFGDVVLEVDNLWVRGDLGDFRVQGVTISVRSGEILGIAGITGNGQAELFEAIMGLRRVEKGSVRINGIDVANKDTAYIRSLGVGYIPDNPLRYGLSTEHTLVENVAISPKYSSFILDWNTIKRDAEKLVREYGIVTPNIYTPVKLLSGGNLMKTLVSRELEYSTRLLVAYNPTRGLDEYTATKVRQIIKRKARRENVAVIFASEDLDEIFELSDTIAVINSGKIVGLFKREEAEREKVEELMVM